MILHMHNVCPSPLLFQSIECIQYLINTLSQLCFISQITQFLNEIFSKAIYSKKKLEKIKINSKKKKKKENNYYLKVFQPTLALIL